MTDRALEGLLVTLDGAAAQPGFVWSDLMFPALMLGIIYFLVIRPQSQQQADHQAFVAALGKDDEVVTKSGLHGRVVQVNESTVILEIGERARVTFDKDAIVRRQGAPAPAAK